MEIDLSEVKFKVDPFKNKKGQSKSRDLEDRFQLATLQASCHTPKFSIDYVLRITTQYQGCVCCVDIPDLSVKMFIVPSMNPACFGFHPAPDFEPTQLGMFTIVPKFE